MPLERITITGAQLRSLRRRLALTQVEMATAIGIRPETLCRAERGRSHLSPLATRALVQRFPDAATPDTPSPGSTSSADR